MVVPTYRERANVPVLFERVKAALDGLPWEMIVVDDDSPDGTSEVAFAIAVADSRMRCLRRVNRSGLAGAVIEGWMASSADYVAVIDGDLQHDETILPKMYGQLEAGAGNLAIGTRVARRDRGRPVAGAPEAQRPRAMGLQPDRRRVGRRPDERLFHDPAGHRLAAGAAVVSGRLQDPGRRGPVGDGRIARGRGSLPVPRARGRRIEAHAAGRSRLSRPRRPPRERRRCSRSASFCSP